MRKLLLSFFILCLASFAQIHAQTAPKYSNEFLSIGVGARAFAMSNAVVASQKGVDATYWNPSALVNLDNPINLALMHSEYFAGLSKYDYGALALKIDDKSAFGISVIRFGIDNIPNTLELIDSDGNIRFDRIKAFSVTDFAVTLSYASKVLIENLSVGGNVKIIRRKGGDFASAWGFGLDASALYTCRSWEFGAMVRDVTTTFNSWTFNTSELEDVFRLTGNVIPTASTEITLPKIILGAARQLTIYNKFGALAEVDIDISTDGKRNVLIKSNTFSVDPHIGAEFYYNNMIFLRAGVGNFQKEFDFDGSSKTTMQPNIGLGISYKRFTIDYSLTDLGDVSAAGYSHVFSISYGMDKLKID